MASPEPSPKRQRMSPPNDNSPSLAAGSLTDSAYASSATSQVNGMSPQIGSTATKGTLVPLATVPEAEDTSDATLMTPAASAHEVKQEEGQSSADHRRTDHERLAEGEPSATEDLPLLCKKPHSRARPHPTENLVSLYSLSSLAATVARRDPVTGAKINKLRKSYEGKVKKQDLPGRNKPTVLEGELMGFMEWPEEGWYDQRIYGRELEHALDPQRGRLFRNEDPGQPSKLDRALTMLPGRLPRDEDDKWRATLALDDPAAAKAPPKPVNPLLQRPGLAGTGLRASAPASPRVSPGADRPDRAGKKRRYDDSSFEGYEAQGWSGDDDGYASAAGKGKRRRVSVGVQ